MYIKFTKMQGTGNDFVVIDQFGTDHIDFTKDQIHFLCNRRIGVGADGLMILRDHKDSDFEMIYYNSDGNLSSMCGNGGRCIVKYAYDNRFIEEQTSFVAPDGLHDALVSNELISLEMKDVADYASANGVYILDTGSPHYITFVNDLEEVDVKSEGASIRYSPAYRTNGINVNFVQIIDENRFKIRTYERGVEDETLSCGTGVTAAAIASYLETGKSTTHYHIETMGGNLEVQFKLNKKLFTNIKLIGPAETVFEGKMLFA